jgi:hypothetical protein
MLTDDQIFLLLDEVTALLSDDRGSPEDIKKARELMSKWGDDMEPYIGDIEEVIFLLETPSGG